MLGKSVGASWLSGIKDALIMQLTTDPSIRRFLEPISLGLELVGVAVIVYGALVTLMFLVRTEAKNVEKAGHRQYRIKQQFTSRILTGLEFFIAGDVLKTIINPTLESLTVVGAIVAIRAALTYLLNRELKEEEKGEKPDIDSPVKGESPSSSPSLQSSPMAARAGGAGQKGEERAKENDDDEKMGKETFHAEGA